MSYDKNMWNSIKNELSNDNTRKEEINNKVIKCQNNQSLRFYEKVYGNAGPSGYCLFICLHGGGQGPAQMNDDQWRNIIPFENGGFKQGTIAVAPRGITNTWNLHFVHEATPAISRLVENYIIFRNVDPNKVYLMGFSAGGDGTYALSERLPFLFAACSPQAGHPNGINTVNLCNLPTYLAAGEKDTAFKRNQICVDYYKKIMDQNAKYLGNYIAKVEVVAGSGHSFQCWKVPRNSFFNGASNASQSQDTAFTFMYSYTRNPHPKKISCEVKTFLTPLRNYYTQRGNSFYNIELGKNPPEMIQLEINYDNNTINIKEGNNFKLNLVSSLFKKGDTVQVNHQGKTQSYKLQRDQNYARNNMKLYCDPNFCYDSFINIGNYEQEINLAYAPKPAFLVTPQAQQPAPPKHEPPKIPHHNPQPQHHKQSANHPPSQLPQVNQATRNNHNPAQYIDKAKNGKPYMCVKLAETEFAWSNQNKYWEKRNNGQSLMGKQIYHLIKVFYLNPKAHFYDVPKGNYFLLLRHNAGNSSGLNTLVLTVKVDDNKIYSNKFFNKNYKTIRNKNLYDQFVVNIKENQFKNQDKHEVYVDIVGQDSVKKEWDLDGFILIPDNCDGKIETIHNQYFSNGLIK